MAENRQLLDEIVQPDEIQQYRLGYEKAQEANQVTDQNKFAYAYCLVRSKAKPDVRVGITLLRELYDATRNDNAKRDYLYYLALGNARLGEYEVALKFLDGIIHVQPGNHQAKNLRDEISRRMTREGYIGMGIAVGAGALLVGAGGLIILGGLTAAAVAMLKK